MNDKIKTDGKTLSENDAETEQKFSVEDAAFFGIQGDFSEDTLLTTPLAVEPPLPENKPEDSPPEPEPKKPEESWERPAPMAHDYHYKSWMMFIGVVLLVVAFFRPVKLYFHKAFYKPPVTSTVRNSHEFIALAYYGVEEAPQPGSSSVSTAMFREQLKMLVSGGYNPITLKDVRDFYKDGKLLPPKAVLLTFEQAKRGTYNQVRDILQSYKWPAVMGVNTLSVRSMNQETLIWHYLREMQELGFWELAAESNLGFTQIETAPDDTAATFFTSPMWISAENRYELPREFEKRIEADHLSVLDDFKKETDSRPIAFFFPLGNYGQYDERAQMVRAINLRQVDRHYNLGFVVGMLALNTKTSDPRKLNRLLVDPSWSPNAFISMVDAFWPKPWSNEYEKSVLYSASAWLADWGEVFSRNDILMMHALPSLDLIDDMKTGESSGTAGAKAWLIGSDTFQDGHISFLFNMRHGRFGVYLRAKSQSEYIFIGIDERGQVTARQKLADMDELILASDSLETDVSVSHNLTIHLRDNLMFVHLDGKMLFDGRIILRGESHPGLIGASVWDSLVGVASTEIISTRIAGRRDAVVAWTPENGRNIAYLNRWLNENAYRFTVIAPPWIDIVSNGPTTASEWDAPSVSLLSISNGAKVMPRVRVRDIDSLMKVVETDIVKKAVARGVDGVFVDASDCDINKMPPLVSWLTRFNDQLQANKIGLVLQLPTGIEKLSSSINIVKMLPGVILVGDNLESFNLPSDRAMPVVYVPPSDINQTLKYYYQVSNIMADAKDVSMEAKNEELRQDGFDAFGAADYAAAISQWSKWSQNDPENAEPLSLIGDAFLKQNAKRKASEFYAASLAKNPGQINLAIRQSQLLNDLGQTQDATELLDTYARTFPGNPEISIAQARWLDNSNHHGEARDLMSKLVASQPQNIEARLVLQNYLDEPTNRYDNMHQLLSLGSSSESHLFGFAQDIISSELLTIPESTIFFPFIRHTAKNGPNKSTRDIYASLLPITNSIIEDFSENYLSDNWVPWNGLRSSYSGKYELKASASASEAFLRLKNSELMRDGIISITIDESAGAFWLYARRSSQSMLRFGYDNDGFIRMQTWFDGKLCTSESEPWLRPPGEVKLSLEVRGDGAMGFENGKPLFPTRIKIPKEICYGWWSIAPYSPTLGSASASIVKIEVSPLPSGIALVPQLPSTKIPAIQEMLRTNVRDVSIVAPVAFKQNPNGNVPTTPDIDLSPYKMFCAFHRIRLVPVVELPYYSIIRPSILADLVRKHNFEGLIVRVTSMPPESWFEEMASEMEKTTGNMIVIQSTQPLWPNDPKEGQTGATNEFTRLRALSDIRVREIQRGNLILPPIRDEWSLSPLPIQEWSAETPEERCAGIEPRIVIAPTTEFVSEADLPNIRKLGAEAHANRPPPIPESLAKLQPVAPSEKDLAKQESTRSINGFSAPKTRGIAMPWNPQTDPLARDLHENISNTFEQVQSGRFEQLSPELSATNRVPSPIIHLASPVAATNVPTPLAVPPPKPTTPPAPPVQPSPEVTKGVSSTHAVSSENLPLWKRLESK